MKIGKLPATVAIDEVAIVRLMMRFYQKAAANLAR